MSCLIMQKKHHLRDGKTEQFKQGKEKTMSKIYQVKNGKQTIEIKANGLCDLEEKVMTLPKISKKK